MKYRRQSHEIKDTFDDHLFTKVAFHVLRIDVSD